VGRVRSFVKSDIPQVAELYRKVFSHSGHPSEALKAYIEEVFLDNPLYDPNLPSLLYEEDGGRIVGFLGVMPRRMLMKGQSLKMAVASQFMVDPASRGEFAGVKLLKVFFSGPQHIAMTDGANATARGLWETMGGVSVPIYSIYWMRTLRPWQYGMERLREGGEAWWHLGLPAARPLCRLLDTTMAARLEGYGFRPGTLPYHAQEESNEDTICGILTRLAAGWSLHPEYTPTSMKWLLSIAGQKTKFGPLRNEVLHTPEREIAGCYVYYLNVDGVSNVLQLAALPGTISGVLEHLFYVAWRQGSVAISGRLEPKYMHEIYHQRCRFRCGSAMLVHAKDPALLHPIYTGNAFLTRLEGEWWNRFSELTQ
jgi:hypothetical protein